MSWTGRSLHRIALLLVALGLAAATARSAPEVEQSLRQLEQEVQELRDALRELERRGPQESPALDELERRIEILAAEIERLKLGEAAVVADVSARGLGPAASKIYRTERGVSLGGYGEMLFEHFASEREDGEPAERDDRLDFLRAVVYFGYKFNDRWLFNSEIEFEHASTGENGEASVEFAYIDYLWRDELNARAGMLLVPMGFINELHEPTTFLSSLRPDVERVIIPSTWRENGAGVAGDLGPFSYRSYVVNGLDASGFSASGLRGGRQKGSQALAESFAWVGRLDYVGRPGLVAGGSVYAGPSGQGLSDAAGRDLGVMTTILEGHLEWRWRGAWARLLGVQAQLDDVARLNEALGLEGSASVGERLRGGYLELGYDVLSRRPTGSASLTPLFRWEGYDTQSQVPAGFERNPARQVTNLTFGAAFKPIDQVVIKADYRASSNEADTGVDQLNVALGYIF